MAAGKSSSRRFWLAILLGSLAVWLLFGPKDRDAKTAHDAEAPRVKGEGDVALSAKGACRIAIPQVMNDPDSVDFEPSDTWAVTLGEDHKHVVRVGLRARNAFNALMYAEFDCYVEDRGEDWIVDSVVQVTP
jgi:hypothetical protein